MLKCKPFVYVKINRFFSNVSVPKLVLRSLLSNKLKLSDKASALARAQLNSIEDHRFMGNLYKKKLKIRQHKLFKKFRYIINNTSGRNNSGKITVRHRGSKVYNSFLITNNKNFYFSDVPTRILNIHPMGRKITSNFGMAQTSSGVFYYMRASDNLHNFKNIFNSKNKITRQMTLSVGSRTTLRYIPTGSFIYDVEALPNNGSKFARSAGCKMKLMMKKSYKSKDYAGVLLPSKKLIYLPLDCQASFGVVSNKLHKLQDIKLAGIRRKQGFRPSVRGVAMNPIDHHHGGGEGKTSSGPKPKTAWGKIWRFVKTRSKSRESHYKIFVRRINKYGINISSVKKLY